MGEAARTLRALEWLLAAVKPPVFDEVVLVLEGLLAALAGVGPSV